MNIRAIALSELEEFISSDEYLRMDPLPITPERARSQMENPHGLAEDPVLWLAFDDENKLIGFIGSLPGRDNLHNVRMGWNSCWWVDPISGNEAAMPLFYTFLKQWDMKVAFSDMTSSTFPIIKQMDFCHIREEKLFTGYIRFSYREQFHARSKSPYPLAPLMFLTIPVVNGLQSLRLSTIARNLRAFQIEKKDHADDEMMNFIHAHHAENFPQRDGAEFNWIVGNKWLVKSSKESISIADRYPFTYVSDDFELKWILTRRDDEINTIMLVSIRDHVLKVLYYFGKDHGFALLALKSIIAGNSGIRKVMFSHPDLVANSKMLNSILVIARIKKRLIAVSKKLLDSFPPDLVMQMGDGDAVFT